MKKILVSWLGLLLWSCSGSSVVNYIAELENVRNPRIIYWFWTPDILENDKYLSDFEDFISNSSFDMIFLSARNGCDFYDTEKYHPYLSKLVEVAHNRGVKIGLQLWSYQGKMSDDLCQRVVTEEEFRLDNNGKANFTAKARHIRTGNIGDLGGLYAYKSEPLRLYAFRKSADGIYDANTLIDITDKCKVVARGNEQITVSVDAGQSLGGYDVYAMTEHFYNHPDMFGYAAQSIKETLEKYRDIPFDGTALDEYTYMRITPRWNMSDGELFRERFYSPSMAEFFKSERGEDLIKTMFDMRYAPTNLPKIRAVAINDYMDVMRCGPLRVEEQFYADSKSIFGEETFIGVHNTFHNVLIDDEIWSTGANWWTVPRDYGHTDEHSSLPVQMGIAFSNPSKNVIYNMFYHPKAENIYNKALTDLRYGIRTHYHAINDKQDWGVSLEDPAVQKQINQIERAAAILNNYNGSLPEVKLLVVFGSEALSNWYPDHESRSMYDINDKLEIEEKAIEILKAGYMNALVPSDLIENGKLTLNEDNKPVLGGNVFDAIIYLYPQYAREKTLAFLEKYSTSEGKLMIEGDADTDFSGNDIKERIEGIKKNAVAKNYSLAAISELGISKNVIESGCKSADGSVVLTNFESMRTGRPTPFSVEINGDTYSGNYCGMLAFNPGNKGRIEKLASYGLLDIRKNGDVLLSFSQVTRLILDKKGRDINIVIEDDKSQITPLENNL